MHAGLGASPSPVPANRGAGRAAALAAAGPGLVASAVIAVGATALGHLLPVVGAPVFAIVLGVLVATALSARTGTARTAAAVHRLDRGAAFAGGAVLQLSVVVLGTGLSLRQVLHTGAASLPVMLGTLAVALIGARLIGRALHVEGDARTLIGVGTGICGASAIAAVTAVIGAAEADVAYAIATIFTFNIAAVLLYPSLGHLLGLSQHAFGLWTGTAINDTSSVVAAATTYGSSAASYGVIVKLTRSLMIIPICVGLGALLARRPRRVTKDGTSTDGPDAIAGQTATVQTRARLPWRRMFPLFLLGFLLASALDSVGAIPASWHPGLTTTSTWLITVALAGIGLTTRPAALRAAGIRPLLLGGALWVCVGAASLLLQLATGTLR